MGETIEYDHYPEVVDNNRGQKRVELFGLSDVLADAHERRKFFANLDDDGYRKFAGYVNSVAQKKPVSYEYGNGRVLGIPTPPPEDKAPLMANAFNTIREILNSEDTDETAALRRAGLTAAGALNYIHPYDNGNGRTGRILHYLIEFGTQRGERAFNDELYAVVAKTQAYEHDRRYAIYDRPPAELFKALWREASGRHPATWKTMDERHAASECVRVFLDMMAGKSKVLINEDVMMPYADATQPSGWRHESYPAGTMTGDKLYEEEYVKASTVPSTRPEDVPAHAQRVLATRDQPPSTDPQRFLELDYLPGQDEDE